MGELSFFMGDLYPQMLSGQRDTSTEMAPDANDQQALAEDRSVSEKVDNSTPQTIKVFIAIAFVIILVMLFGLGD